MPDNFSQLIPHEAQPIHESTFADRLFYLLYQERFKISTKLPKMSFPLVSKRNKFPLL